MSTSESELTFLISTTQRCGSTWLTKMLSRMTSCQDRYVNGLAMGFRLGALSQEDAGIHFTQYLTKHPKWRVLKTHDIPVRDFGTICHAMPRLRIITLQRDFRDVVVSRYFHLRYHWRTNLNLGPLPAQFAKFLQSVEELPDQESLAALLDSQLLCNWARDWLAFEGPITTPHAIRLTYAGLLAETDLSKLMEFTGLPLRRRRKFSSEQDNETLQTGRAGRALFHRKGCVGEWREWFTPEQGKRLQALVKVTKAEATNE